MYHVEVAERIRRRAKITATIADLIAQAKSLLLDAKQIGKDAGIDVSFDELMVEVGVEQPWYGSDESLC